MNDYKQLMILIVTLARLAGVDAKELGKETLNMKKGTGYLGDLTEGMLDNAIDQKMFPEAEGEMLKDLHNFIKGRESERKYKDKDEGYKR